jgi:hypothetical protein
MHGLAPGSVSPAGRGAGRHWHPWHLVVGAVVVALAAGTVGIFIGRATKSGAEAVSPTSWQPLPKAPIAGRIGESAVWTGKEMIVWGGVTSKAVRTAGPCDRCASDGAAYDPTRRTWRTIAPSPSGVQGGAAVAWTGGEMVVWASNSPDGPVGAAAYDPSTDTWRPLPAGPLGKREGYASVWTGKELIVVGGALGDTLAKPVAAGLNPRTGTWRLLPALNRISGLMPGPGVAWDAQEVFVMGAVCAKYLSSCSPRLLTYDPSTGALRRISLATAPIVKEQQLTLVGRSGIDLVFSTVGVASSTTRPRDAGARGPSLRSPAPAASTSRQPGSAIASSRPTGRAASRSTASPPAAGRRSAPARPRSTRARAARSSGQAPT